MAIEVISTTDSQEIVAQANASDKSQQNEKEVVDEKPKSASPENIGEDESNSEESETTEESENQEETEDSETEESDRGDEKPKKKGGWKRRFDKITKDKTAAEQERDYWRDLALKNKAEPEKKSETKTEQTAGSDDEPKTEDFETYGEFQKAVAKWAVRQERKAAEAEAKAIKEKTEFESKLRTHTKRVDEFKKTHEDFDEVIAEVDHIRASAAVEQVILDSDFGPQLMYELASNPKEFERINSLSPVGAARELGKIEARFLKSESPKPQLTKTPSKAPQPIKPLGAGSTGGAKKSLSDPNLSQKEYERLREAEERARKNL